MAKQGRSKSSVGEFVASLLDDDDGPFEKTVDGLRVVYDDSD